MVNLSPPARHARGGGAAADHISQGGSGSGVYTLMPCGQAWHETGNPYLRGPTHHMSGWLIRTRYGIRTVPALHSRKVRQCRKGPSAGSAFRDGDPGPRVCSSPQTAACRGTGNAVSGMNGSLRYTALPTCRPGCRTCRPTPGSGDSFAPLKFRSEVVPVAGLPDTVMNSGRTSRRNGPR